MNYRMFRIFAVAGWALLAMNYVAAQASLPVRISAHPSAAATAGESASIDDWLMRMHEASRKRAYIGTFVVSSGGILSSAKIWNVCEGNQQMERIETLTGAPRSIFRHNEQVVIFMPDQKLARSETRESLGIFQKVLQPTDSHIADFYQLRQSGVERVAGVEANIIELVPRDNLRFGYRVWTEQRTALVVKRRAPDPPGNVLERGVVAGVRVVARVESHTLTQ